MINRIYSLVLFISNNELRGNVTPSDYNLALYNAIIEVYEEYFFELNRAITRKNKGLVNNDFADLPEYYREKIKHFLSDGTIEKAIVELPSDTPITTTPEYYYPLPSDLRYLDAIFYKGNELEPVSNSRQFLLAKKIGSIVDSEYPIYLLKGREIDFLPTDLSEKFDIWYLRNPLRPNWTYNVVNGVEVFNPDADDFQDVDIHPSEEGNLIMRVLLKMGINLKEQDLANYIMSQENQQFQKENLN